MSNAAILTQIRSLCARYAHPGVNPGAHALANKIIRMIDGSIAADENQTPSHTDARTEADGQKEKGRHG